MKRLALAVAALILLAASTVLGGASAQTPGPEAKNAAKACKAERGTTDASKQAFAERYGTNGNKKNAFGKCVSKKAKEKAKAKGDDADDEAEDAAEAAAVKACQAERGTTDASRQAFAERYGTNANKKNAFGKCVSQKSKQKKSG